MRYIFYILCLLQLSPLTMAEEEDDKIWHVADQKFISEKSLMTSLAAAQNILLGISPDNPAHHRHAAKIIENLTKEGQKPVILMSYVERSKQNAFAIFAQRHKDKGKDYDATGLDMLLDWSNSGQPDWAVVKPVFDTAMLKKLSLKAINFSRYEIGQLHLNGLDGLPADIKSVLLPLLSIPVGEKIAARITEEIHQEYCDILPRQVLVKFDQIRRARDGLFALMMAGTGLKTAVFIAPRKHVAKDTGVPRILKELDRTGKSISLSFVEAGQKNRPKQTEQVDFIWYTAGISRPRPCQYHSTN